MTNRSEYNRRYRARKKLQDPNYYKKKSEEYLAANMEKVKLQKKINRLSDVLSNSPEYKLFMAAKHRASLKGREFDLELSDIVIPTHCPVLGIPIVKLPSDHPDYDRDNSPSLDRLDNDKGYTKDNICVMSFKANNMKTRANLQDMKKLIDFLESKFLI